jgi:TusA-related sulfurtransferase
MTLDEIYHIVVLLSKVLSTRKFRAGASMPEVTTRRDWERRTKGTAEPLQVDKELSLKGKICPYTFIESMLTLEEMGTNQILRIIVDYPQAVFDVPRSLKNEGYEIIEVSPINETDWAILVRNKEVE